MANNLVKRNKRSKTECHRTEGAGVTTTAHAIPHPDEKRTLDLWPETGVALGLGRSSTYEAAARGEIPTIRIGRSVRVRRDRLERWLDEQSAA